MKAVILAAGKGTRLKHLSQDSPKPMIPIRGKCMLERIIGLLKPAGIEEFVIITGYLSEQIVSYFQDGSRWNVKIEYVHQPVQNGTGGAVRLAKKTINNSPFLLTWGDIITSKANYLRMATEFQSGKVDGLLGVNPVADPYRGAAVYFDEFTRKVTQIIEKPPQGTSQSRWNNAGLFVFDPILFSYLEKISLSPRGEYEFPDAVRLMLQAGCIIRAVPLEGFWGEIGTPEDVESLQRQFQQHPDFLE